MRRTLQTAVLVTLAALVVAAVARADDPTREGYTAQVEPICQANVDANKEILKGVRDKVKQDKFGVAGKQFSRAARKFKLTVDQIAAVPQPPADETRLDRWIGILEKIDTYLKKISGALKQRDRFQARVYAVQLQGIGNSANNVAQPFHFNYCRVTPSRFSGS
jgi:hypothetical protein